MRYITSLRSTIPIHETMHIHFLVYELPTLYSILSSLLQNYSITAYNGLQGTK